jgi:hypothetical protein
MRHGPFNISLLTARPSSDTVFNAPAFVCRIFPSDFDFDPDDQTGQPYVAVTYGVEGFDKSSYDSWLSFYREFRKGDGHTSDLSINPNAGYRVFHNIY